MNTFFRNKTKKGFTLIELLVVIAIIGVLASIVLASLNTARQKSRDARRITDMKQIQLALELYYDAIGAGQYPAASANIAANCVAGGAAYGLEALASTYIPQVPRDPNAPAPNCYRYATAAAGARSTYHLGTTLEDSANSAFTGDRDCNDQAAAGAPVCPTGAGATGGFAGADPLYDLVP